MSPGEEKQPCGDPPLRQMRSTMHPRRASHDIRSNRTAQTRPLAKFYRPIPVPQEPEDSHPHIELYAAVFGDSHAASSPYYKTGCVNIRHRLHDPGTEASGYSIRLSSSCLADVFKPASEAAALGANVIAITNTSTWVANSFPFSAVYMVQIA
jgi:hypothetical protein